MTSAHLQPESRGPGVLAVLAATLVLACPGTASAQSCTAVTLDPPVSGSLDFGRLYVTSGLSGTATLDPASGHVSATGRLVAAQAGVPLSVRVTDASPDCEFILSVIPSSRDIAPAFTAVVDRVSMLEGTLLNTDPAQREWLVRMNNGVARIQLGGVLEMNTAGDGLIDDYVVTFTVEVNPPDSGLTGGVRQGNERLRVGVTGVFLQSPEPDRDVRRFQRSGTRRDAASPSSS